MPAARGITMDKLVELAKRRGFIFPSSEIYGGLASTYDYGPLGVELKNNLKRLWWRAMVQEREDVVGLDAAILMHPKVWEASGHVENFQDPLVECGSCKRRFKADEVDGTKCPECGGKLSAARPFNLMLKTTLGPVEEAGSLAYLRPETAQGIYVNFENVQRTTRRKLPFGVAQIGKAFRNEITPRYFTFRMREFEQMEMQYFCGPKEAPKFFEHWRDARIAWYERLGIPKERLKVHPHTPKELAHYAKQAVDLTYPFPFGESELEGVHNRGDFDLSRHMKFSGHEFWMKEEGVGETFIPYVIETSGGVDRATLAALLEAYTEVEGGRTKTTEATKEIEVVLRLPMALAPIKVAVLPLSKKEKLSGMAKEIHADLRQHFMTDYDEVASIGRRYRRQDEIGTPFCVTVDFDSLEDRQVTVRDRDSMKQERVAKEELAPYLKKKLEP